MVQLLTPTVRLAEIDSSNIPVKAQLSACHRCSFSSRIIARAREHGNTYYLMMIKVCELLLFLAKVLNPIYNSSIYIYVAEKTEDMDLMHR